MNAYTKDIENIMKKYCDSLPENLRRRYAAIETIKLGYGGQKYICDVLKIDPDTIVKGIKELQDEMPLETERIRLQGGGRKKNH
jgi:hypothetical protein